MEDETICPKCKIKMKPEGSMFGFKWWECECGFKYHLHNPHLEPCSCKECEEERRLSKQTRSRSKK